MNFLKSSCAFFFVILLIDCGGGGTTGLVDEDFSETAEFMDFLALEQEDEGWVPEAGDLADGFEFPDEGDAEGEEFETVTQCPGAAGCGCSSNNECYSGFCIPGFDKNICAQLCYTDESCPTGWKCVTISTYPDIVFGCVPLFQHLCKPCKGDGDCFGSITEMKNLCIEYDSNGSYCGSECDSDSQCPEGFECRDIVLRDGSSKQCYPLDGKCPCFEIHVKSGAKTFCYNQNDFGKCFGERLCSESCPAATPEEEKCDNMDNDCDTQADEEGAAGCSSYCYDGDGDYYGLTDNAKCLCSPFGKYNATLCGDCNDEDKNVNPSISEICNGDDDNCDGKADEEGANGCTMYFKDSDGDGFGENNSGKCLCQPEGHYTSSMGGDCDDENSLINPSVKEACNGYDDNCDNTSDIEDSEGCLEYFFDGDKDGFGLDSNSKCLCAPVGKYTTLAGGDCDDQDALMNPKATEVCNLKDDNCNKIVDDEGAQNCKVYYLDMDTDGYGMSDYSKCLCSPSEHFTSDKPGDCDDSEKTIFPGALESCNNKDDNCNNIVDDEGALNCIYFYYDNDDDGYGVQSEKKCLCAALGLYRAVTFGDCNDNDSSVHPFAQEKCNGKDDNCLNGVDEEGASDCTVYYYDGDNDGYGVTGNSKCLCSTSGNFDATLSGDCNDNDKNINPAEQEKCNNKDDNCNNNTDEGTAVQLCGSVANGSPKCDNGTCKISSCSTGWEDIDGQFTSGCECEWDSDDKSGYGNSCPGTVIDLGTLTDNSAKIVTKSSKINPNSDVDWYKFTATDSADSGSPSSLGSDKFHVRARFLSPVSNNPFAFDIFKGGCASILCDGAKDFNWFTNGRCGSGAAAKGEAPCLTKSTCDNNNVCPDGTAANYCADESSVYYIKVYRLSGAASDCSGTEYSIEVSNGAYSAPPCPW